MSKCSYCKNGKVKKLDNYVDFYYEACEPIYIEEDCEECGGTGEQLDDDYGPELCGDN